MVDIEQARQNWVELKAKMKEGYLPTAAEQIGSLHACAAIFRDKGHLSKLLSEELLSWFGAAMDMDMPCDLYQEWDDVDRAYGKEMRLLTIERERADRLGCAITDLRQSIEARDSEITALLDHQEKHDEYDIRTYRLLVTWAANGDITQDMLIAALTLEGA